MSEAWVGVWLIKGRPRSFYLTPALRNTPAGPPHANAHSFNPPPPLALSICRNPYGQSVGNHRAGVDDVPREWGEFVCVWVCVRAPTRFLFHLLVNKAQSACNRSPPTVLYLCFCCVCLLSWTLKHREANEKHTSMIVCMAETGVGWGGGQFRSVLKASILYVKAQQHVHRLGMLRPPSTAPVMESVIIESGCVCLLESGPRSVFQTETRVFSRCPL